ncbi:emp24/gp25L/p24 family/GOLD-domain-containing protein [Globomyces pollinis-pini]|nr:emp24/gp25L/p24 family/GOLD-domain-containing protein [Globomyces pollinis-pini]
MVKHSFITFALSILSFVAASTFSITIQRYSTECFYEQLTHGDRLEVSYEVIKSTSEYEIDYITNPDGSMLHSVDKHRDAAFGFYAGSTGQHQMCFYNQNSPAEKVISFSFLGPDDLAHLKAPDGSNEVALGKDLQSLSNEIRFMKDELSYMNRRLSRHKQTAESTNSRVFWWAFFQLLLLVAVSLFQISYLRQFFEKRRII